MVRAHVLSKSNRASEWSAHTLLHQCLNWLPGAPVDCWTDSQCETRETSGISWLKLATANGGKTNRVTINPEKLRLARFAVKKLKHEKPRQLKRWLPDPTNYLVRIEHLLECLKLPSQKRTVQFAHLFSQRWQRQYNALHRSHPPLRRLIQAIAFYQLSQREPDPMAMLDWIRQHADALIKIQRGSGSGQGVRSLSGPGSAKSVQAPFDPLEMQITLCLLRDDVAPNWLDFIMRVLGADPVALQIDATCRLTAQLYEDLVKVAKERPAKNVELEKTNQLFRSVVHHVSWLQQQKPQRRRNASRVLAAMADVDLLKFVGDAMDDNDREQQRLKSEIRRCRQMGPINYAIAVHHSKSDAELRTPESFQWKSLREALKCLEANIKTTQDASVNKQWSVEVARFMTVTKEMLGYQRIKVIFNWNRRFDAKKDQSRSYQKTLRKLLPMLTRRGASSVLRCHWAKYAAGGAYRDELVCELADSTLSESDWRKTLELLEHFAYQETAITDDLLCNFGYFAKYAPTLELARQSIVLINQAKEPAYFDHEEVSTALKLSDDPVVVAELFQAFETSEIAESAQTIAKVSDNTELQSLTCRLALAGKRRSLQALGRHINALTAVGRTCPKLPENDNDAAWILQYPESLHDVLDVLNRRCENAREIAVQLLRNDFPTPEKIKRDIEKLGEKLCSSSVSESTREKIELARQNLQRRLANPKKVGGKRLENLANKLQSRLDKETIVLFETLCRELVAAELKRFAPHAGLSPRLFQRPYSCLLPAVFDLSGREKKIAIALLLRADDEKKNQLPLARANQQFVDRMTKRGVDMDPWLAASEAVEITNDAGDKFQIGFATDTLDLLLMGFHFDTCLSPDSFNFYSAVTNTIDVNKQVLYCRDKKGAIVGRCLFALTADGRIQTYRRYLHDAKLDFESVVDKFAVELASRMGASLTSNGTISALVAKNWYDDGATVGGLAMLNDMDDNSPVIQLFKSANAETFVSDLVALLGSRDTVSNCLDTLLEKTDLTSRPDLIAKLANEFGRDPKSHVIDKMRLAVLSLENNQNATTHGILDSLDHRKLIRRLSKGVCRICPDIHGVGTEQEIIDVLLDYDFRLAKRFLVATRDHDVESDDQEKRKSRRLALSTIHNRLGRKELAQRLQQPRRRN